MGTTPIKKDSKINTSNNNTEKISKNKTEIKIPKTTLEKSPNQKSQESLKNNENNNENIINEMNPTNKRSPHEEERIRRILASLEKYRINQPEIPKRPTVNPNIKHKKKETKKIIQNEKKDNNNIKQTEKKVIKSEIKTEKEIKPVDSNPNKEKEKEKDVSNNNKNELLNKKRERENTEKKEKKDKIIPLQKKEIKKPIAKKIILDDDEEDEDDSYDEDYEIEDDKSYSESSGSESSEKSFPSESSHKKKNIKTKSPETKTKVIKKESGISSTKKESIKPKGILVNEILKRWWYALPPWPPENYDTSEKLKENKLRLVKIIDWKKEPKMDKDNLEKCLELPGFKYVYLNTEGKIFDFRPEEGKPSYNNLKKLPDVKLHEYLAKALKGQLEELEKRNSVNEKELREKLKEKLEKEEKVLARLNKNI